MAYNSGVKTFMREAASWGAVVAIGFGCVYFYDDMRQFAARTIAVVAENHKPDIQEPVSNKDGFERSVTLTADRRGHFYTKANINGRAIAVMVDTGATTIALPYEDADRLGLRPRDSDYTSRVSTANGMARAAPVSLHRVEIGDVEVRNIRGLVLEPGKLTVTLLGMEFIRRLDRFELSGNTLVLVE